MRPLGKLRINCSTGALSPGDLANATIGRAMALIVKNLGGARKAVEDMGVMGNPAKYAMVLGENEEASPWEPLSDSNCMTVSFPNSYLQFAPGGRAHLLAGRIHVLRGRRGAGGTGDHWGRAEHRHAARHGFS